MSFWKKLFGNGVETVSAGPTDSTSVPQSPTATEYGLTTAAASTSTENTALANARRLAADHEWNEALLAVEEFLALPSDEASAKARLETLLQEESKSGPAAQRPPESSSAHDILSSLTHQNDDSITAAMALRSKCLAILLKNSAKAKSDSYPGAADNSDTVLREKSNAHVQLVSALFNSDIANLAGAAAICHFLGDSQRAQELLARIAEAIPDKTTAAAMLKIAAKRMSDIS